MTAGGAAPEQPRRAPRRTPSAASGLTPQDVVPDAPAVPAVPTAPEAVAPSAPAASRRWWHRLRPQSAAPSAAEPEPGSAPLDDERQSLLYRSPFQMGFAFTMGGLLAFGLVLALVSLQSLVILGVLSLFIALGLNPIVDALRRIGLPRGVAVAVVALLIVLVLGLAAWAVLPVFTVQVNQLIVNMPSYLQGLRENETIAAWDARYGIIQRATELVTSGTWLEGLFGGILGAGLMIANTVFSVFVTLVLTLWFLAFLPSIKNTIYQLAPGSRRPRVRYLANQMFDRIGGYMTGLFTVVALASTAAFLFLNIVGLGNLALALTAVVAGFAFIPLVGPTISMLLVSLVAFGHSPVTGIATLIFFLVYQQIDAYVIQPRVFQRSVNVPGPLVVLAALSGGLLFGIAGALLAIPTMASLLLLYQEVLVPALDRA